MVRDKKVDRYIEGLKKYKDILISLRSIIEGTELEETVKWGMPCYTINGKNVIGISAFKNHAGIWFYQGAILNDKLKVLRNAQEGKTQAMRHWKFTDIGELNKANILSYLKEAINNEKKGIRVKMKKIKTLEVPDVLSKILKANKKAAKGFASLTPGRQRDYAEYISSAKRSTTVQSRLDKIIPMIEMGVGLNDKYQC